MKSLKIYAHIASAMKGLGCRQALAGLFLLDTRGSRQRARATRLGMGQIPIKTWVLTCERPGRLVKGVKEGGGRPQPTSTSHTVVHLQQEDSSGRGQGNMYWCRPLIPVLFFPNISSFLFYLETECRLFPPVTIFLDLFPCAGYFFNAFD